MTTAVRHTIGVGELKVSKTRGDTLVTHALGSCLGIAVHDSVACVGGLLHAMLPSSAIDPGKAEQNPYLFINTGVPALFRRCYELGAVKERLEVKVAGGAGFSLGGDESHDIFQIGKRNILMLERLFQKNGVSLKAHDVGGKSSRTMLLEIGTGQVTLKMKGRTTVL